jgi:L-aspartate oxidase
MRMRVVVPVMPATYDRGMMSDSFPRFRRYLTDFDATRTSNVFTDILVVGAGIAGLTAARGAADFGEVVVLSKGNLEMSSTHWAQGGVAAVVSPEDSVDRHVRDTLEVGAGLNHRDVVEFVCREGPRRIDDLIAEGFAFDRENGELALGLEGGHHEHRVLHAGGDATGKAINEFLNARARAHQRIRIFDHCFLVDLITVDGVCAGAVTFHPQYGHQLIWAGRTILASGGYSQLYRETTNPPGITGDGLAAAWRAGAVVADMELEQFHPTTLYVAGSSRALISEAVRGEGAHLVDRAGRRFMPEYHQDAELAPRDVVSRAIVDQLKKSQATSVFLDVSPIGAERFAERFPTIKQRCADFGIDVARDRIPIRPAAHFSIGGVVIDREGRTSLPGLYACGEVSCSGLHGANRLASNSLLEGLVFGRVCGLAAGESALEALRPPRRMRNENPRSPKTMLDLADVRQSLRSLMWRNAGIVRHGDRLAETAEIVEFWSRFTLDKTFDEPSGWEIQNLLTLGWMVADAGTRRASSCGVHYRADSADQASNDAPRHLTYRRREDALERGELGLDLTLD